MLADVIKSEHSELCFTTALELRTPCVAVSKQLNQETNGSRAFPLEQFPLWYWFANEYTCLFIGITITFAKCSSQDAATFQGLWISLFMNVGCLVKDQEQWRLEIKKKQPNKEQNIVS